MGGGGGERDPRDGLVGAGGVFTYVLSYIMPNETRLNRREKSGA